MTVEPAPRIPTLDRDPALAVPLPRDPAVTDPAATDPAPSPLRFADPWHLHTQGCYWDFRSAGWVCP